MNPISRVYMPHRRAYTPRLWPSAVLTLITVWGLAWITHAGPVLAGILGVVIGWSYAAVRWRLWRQRHPIISAQEYLDDIRESARWN